MSFTFEFALQVWTSKLENQFNGKTFNGQIFDDNLSWHEIVMMGPAAALPYFLRFSNHYRHVDSGIVALTALVNVGAVHKDRILYGLAEFNYDGNENYEQGLLGGLIDLQGPRGPYLLEDIANARKTKQGPVWTLLKKRASKRWSMVLFAIAVKKMWYLFLERILHPDSGYFRRVLVRRFYTNTFPNYGDLK